MKLGTLPKLVTQALFIGKAFCILCTVQIKPFFKRVYTDGSTVVDEWGLATIAGTQNEDTDKGTLHHCLGLGLPVKLCWPVHFLLQVYSPGLLPLDVPESQTVPLTLQVEKQLSSLTSFPSHHQEPSDILKPMLPRARTHTQTSRNFGRSSCSSQESA